MRQDSALRSAIESLGTEIGPEVLHACQALFDDKQRHLGASLAPAAIDVEYGPHARHRLDLYAPQDLARNERVPIFVWVHGGGFIRGEKLSEAHPFNAHIGRWIAKHRFVGIVMNYRLAPEASWPSGGEDVARVVEWIKQHADKMGGDAHRIVLGGTSAGAAHIATYMQFHPKGEDVRGLVLLSGLYGCTPIEPKDRVYFDNDDKLRAAPAAHTVLANSGVPLFLGCAQFDPSRFQAETVGLLSSTLHARGRLPYMHVASGHNHYTMAMHLGTEDSRLADEIIAFVSECTGR